MIMTALFILGCKDSMTYERSEKVMGTLVTLKATGYDAQIAVDESFTKIFEFVDAVKVDVKNLNDGAGNGNFVKISPEVFEVLKISKEYYGLTDGAFDVTIGAAVDLWKVAKKNKILPTSEEIDAVKNLVGSEHLHLDEKNCSAYLDTAGVKINLGGVGKGYGVDIARKIFIRHKISDGLIDFGTSTIYAFGKKNIGIKNPRGEGLTEIIEIENAAVSTSGDYENFFEIDGKRYHHIINPKNCKPAENNFGSSTVIISREIENCATVADILSTSTFIIGDDRIFHMFIAPSIKFIKRGH